MLVPGLTLTEVFQRVRDGVAYYTGDQQLPWSQSYLAVGDFYFKPRPRTLAQLAAAAPHTVVQDTARAEQIKLSRETLEWILDSADARVSEELESYASAIKEKEFAFLREDRSDNSATRVNNMFRVAYASPVLEAAYRLVRQYAENKESEKMVRLVALFDGKGFFKSEQAARHIAQVRKASSVRDNITFKAALCDIGRAQPTYRKAVLELARFDRYKDDPPLEPGVPDWSFLGKGLAEVVAPMVVVGMAFSGKGAKMPPPEKPACSF
jgi:hypothetical protein